MEGYRALPGLAPDWRGSDGHRVRGSANRQRGQAVAVKRPLQFTPAALYRFKQEFRTLADVLHPNLVLLHELTVTEGDGAFIAMDLVVGTDFLSYVTKAPTPPSWEISLTERPKSRPEAPLRAAHELESTPADLDKLRSALRQVVGAVQALHAAGKLHRDIKPSDVLVTPEGHVVVLDFGLATDLPTSGRRERPGRAGNRRYRGLHVARAGARGGVDRGLRTGTGSVRSSTRP